ncbi:MAG: hypothetical protein CMP75_02600 [Flavobacteriales bacterium]|nr:hypothetical protein [Flavobacteriales bacterium]|tara:strand:+ start:932 stop:2062 length:1131 start_codon:yes stop_codon:yes gene_type:complete
MKKVALLFATVCLWGFSQAQESVIKISSGDAAFGRYEISYERTFNEGMNNIKSSGKLRSQKAWPNILTKSSFQVSFSYISKKHSQTFGNGLTAVVDTNSNHDLGNLNNGLQVVDHSSIHSVSRNTVSTVSGIAFEGEYRSYIKTYKQNIGDAPRGWYIAPFFRFQTTTLDFDDNTAEEVNWAMNRLMYGDDNVFNGNTGPWEGDEDTGTPITWTNPNSIPDGLRWHDVSFKQNETVLAGGLAIGRQWLFGDKISLDVQVGPQYKLVTRSERVFNGNDTWNMNQQSNNVNNLAYPAEFYFFNKYGDVYDFEGNGGDNEVANGYFGIVDEDGTAVVINGKGDDTTLGYMTGFYRDLPGLTDFAKLETYRLKVRIGYAF